MKVDWQRLRQSVSSTPALLSCALALMTSGAVAQPGGSFAPAGYMTTGRSFHAAVVLRDQTVLVIGEKSADLYDPATRVFTPTGSVVATGRQPTATLLNDGRVLITVGFSSTGSPNNAAVYDPSTRTFTPIARTTDGPAAAILLSDGKVLVFGVIPELFDPFTDRFTVAPGGSSRKGTSTISSVTALDDGRILLEGQPTSEVYDPETGIFTGTGNTTTRCFGGGGRPNYISGRTATLLTNGKVLLTGGHQEDCGRFADAELYDPSTGTFVATGSMARARDNHTATLLADGTVLITGGESHLCAGGGCMSSGTEASAEIYNPATGTFTAAANMAARRAGHTATLLRTGRVLVTGGYFYGGIGQGSCCFADAELYESDAGRRRRSVHN